MKFCPRCGAQYSEGGRFCKQCGAQLPPSAISPVATQPPVVGGRGGCTAQTRIAKVWS